MIARRRSRHFGRHFAFRRAERSDGNELGAGLGDSRSVTSSPYFPSTAPKTKGASISRGFQVPQNQTLDFGKGRLWR